MSQTSNLTEWLHLAKSGDYEAFQQIVSELQPRVYGLAYRILQQSHDAEDVVQQTFLAMIEHIEDFREESSLATWVLRIATNFALKILRKKGGAATVPFDETGEEGYADVPHPNFIAPWMRPPDEIAQDAEVHREIESALAELHERYRSVFVLRDIEGVSVKETAELLGLTESTVKVRLLRARLALREKLTQRFGDALQKMTPDHQHE